MLNVKESLFILLRFEAPKAKSMNSLLKLKLIKEGVRLVILITLITICYSLLNQGDFNILFEEQSCYENVDTNSGSASAELNNFVIHELDLDVIRRQFLTAPSSPTQLRNATKTVWISPVTDFVKKLLKNKTNGFFVEAGANDGEFLSNTLPFEVFDGWTGLLVEPNPAPLQLLLTKRRHAWVAGCCLSPIPCPTKVKMVSHKNWVGLANIPRYFPGLVTSKDFGRPFEVQCFTLHSLLAAINRTEVDYLSLDIEGAELPVLKTIPFDKIFFKVISVETDRKRKHQISEFFSKRGYRKMKSIKKPFVHDIVYMKVA